MELFVAAEESRPVLPTNRRGAMQAEQAAEITRLKRLLAQREEEVAILKKAAAYFAKESR